MDEVVDDTPFWLQSGAASHRGRHLRRSYSMIFSSGAVLIILLVAATAFILIIAPTLHSFSSHILKPHSVKKSWDSLNFVLVLFAILCGFLSKNNTTTTNDTPRSSSYQDQTFIEATQSQDYAKQNPETPMHWYEYSERTPSYNRLRSFNSYPDLRQESWIAAEERWRFYDDTHVRGYREVGIDHNENRELRRRPSRPAAGEEQKEEEQGIIKNIEVDTFEVRTTKVPSSPPVPAAVPPSPPVQAAVAPSPPPAPPPLPSKDRPRHSRVIEKPKYEESGVESIRQRHSPPPPPPLPAVHNKNKRGSATKEFFTSLKGKNRKKQRQRSFENFESILNSEPPPTLPPRQPPPPPPMPPPPSVFQNLFSKKSKHKKGHPDVSSSRTKPQVVVAKANVKPHLRENISTLEENVITGNESPLLPIPPPPPPPPFKLPAWKFLVQGDYVRVDSISSSSSGSPDLDEDVVDSPSSEASQWDNDNSPSSPQGGDLEPEIMLFYPSPDVDTKAGTFIETFRAGLRMEKINSTREKQGIGRSNLGPSTYLERNGPKLKLRN
ncbi:hypothetical protein HN51_042707 [Arachis hypogaea]|uniref:Hydroxyproline-rich glycoprotein family protein n=1 Tax=Arachis hypogaea TaxID=3818 RepID=A0A444Y8M5_ARAHY|nr:pollen-specific leucine-rich repeat extensin-like protein 2 [Arachis ipaensis]XP_025671784.1 pollen-specific leucine-rich repeat extensin-like protein 2 [Arachis hypogaea]QHN94848.1 uncharacterized protein DS421_18g604580 [Arachis hypogaea]RYQ98300.1 hypothetical protein Ahy_B08g094349 [Arachis hypogaea]